ncbi:MAG: hypothetical protein FWD69_02645 [Polyangiaceae bacterium]|nr:hypothetical protein [Polyangiaceae bacterium]
MAGGSQRTAYLLLLAALPACLSAPDTTVVIENHYPPSSTNALVIFRASYKEAGEATGDTGAAFDQPIVPGASSDPQSVVAASDNPAYVLLAPGWDPASSSPPTSFVVLRSRAGFAVQYGDELRIPVDDTTFAGNCASGSVLTQADADFITQRIFPVAFNTLRYDAASCTTAVLGDASAN